MFAKNENDKNVILSFGGGYLVVSCLPAKHFPFDWSTSECWKWRHCALLVISQYVACLVLGWFSTHPCRRVRWAWFSEYVVCVRDCIRTWSVRLGDFLWGDVSWHSPQDLGFSTFPMYMELDLADSVSQPVKTHVHCFGLFLLDAIGEYACCAFVIKLDWGRSLWMAKS